MTQVHKQFTNEQVKVLFQGYTQGNLSRAAVEELLEIGKTRFFALLKAYRENPETFSIEYRRTTQSRLSKQAEAEIQQELLREKALIEDKDLPIHDYNYSAMADRLKKKGLRSPPPQSPSEPRSMGVINPEGKRPFMIARC